jgi:FkbM family methyltransferase
MFRAINSLLQAMGRTTIKRHALVDGGRYVKVEFRGIRRPLYWPASLPTRQLFGTALELSLPVHWHYYEVAETRVLPRDVVLDCGAAEGLFTLRVIERCREAVMVEPLPLFVDCLRRTFEGVAKVRIVAAALADESGTAFLEENGISSHLVNGTTGRTVEVLTIDALCARLDLVPTYLKADLEGFEPGMIAGARETIHRYKPRIAVTTYDRREIAAEVASLLRSFDPSYRIRTKGRVPGTGAPFMLHAW